MRIDRPGGFGKTWCKYCSVLMNPGLSFLPLVRGGRSGGTMAQNALCGSLSMAQLNLLLRQISKSSQWVIFRRLMLVIFLISWFSMVMTSVYVRMSTDGEFPASFTSESTAPEPLFHARKLAAWSPQ
ncbi:hypothetical protein KC19_6G156500 [Ceratodon purpureus]|uniref:Uncharacterized protein n=1 Tax=Ceratodon purpureus TaxID=3225 RepID=A0A8T0HGC4_CERPU|nr:hypothetical protein KC19_6G156500 [Ceratodon purpureus]